MNEYEKVVAGHYDEQIRAMSDAFHTKYELVWEPFEAHEYPWEGTWVARTLPTDVQGRQ